MPGEDPTASRSLQAVSHAVLCAGQAGCEKAPERRTKRQVWCASTLLLRLQDFTTPHVPRRHGALVQVNV